MDCDLTIGTLQLFLKGLQKDGGIKGALDLRVELVGNSSVHFIGDYVEKHASYIQMREIRHNR